MPYQNFMDQTFKHGFLDANIVDGDLLALTTNLPTHDMHGTEVSGGSYTRQATTWLAAANGQKSISGSLLFDDLPLCDVWGWELWAAGGLTRKWVGPWGARQDVAAATGTNTFTLAAHGLGDGDQVHFLPGSVTGGFTTGTKYHVISAAANTFQLSTTQGGAAVTVNDTTPANLGRVHAVLAGADFSVSDFILQL